MCEQKNMENIFKKPLAPNIQEELTRPDITEILLTGSGDLKPLPNQSIKTFS